jgi:hypothetical protein
VYSRFAYLIRLWFSIAMLVCQKVIPCTTPWMVKLYDSGTGLCIPLWLLGTCTIASIYHRLYEHSIVIGLVFINLVPVVIVGLIQYIHTYYKMDWIDFIKKRTRVIYHDYTMFSNACQCYALYQFISTILECTILQDTVVDRWMGIHGRSKQHQNPG